MKPSSNDHLKSRSKLRVVLYHVIFTQKHFKNVIFPFEHFLFEGKKRFRRRDGCSVRPTRRQHDLQQLFTIEMCSSSLLHRDDVVALFFAQFSSSTSTRIRHNNNKDGGTVTRSFILSLILEYIFFLFKKGKTLRWR